MNEKMTGLLRQTEEWIEAHRDEFVSELQGMTRIPSVSRADLAQPGAPFGPDCRRMLDYALSRGRDYSFETMDHEGYAGSICLGDPENAIGLFSHLDVVPVGDGWIYPPFGATYLPEHDAVIGRGADDNKSAAVACLFVLRMLREFGWPLKHGVRLYYGLSEETGMQDMIALREKGMKFPRLSLVPDAGFPVNYGQKGSANGDIAIECCGNLLSFDAGTARNVVPDLAECVLSESPETVTKVMDTLDGSITAALTISPCPEGTHITAAGKSAHTASPESGVNAAYLLSRALTLSGLLTGSCSNAIQQLCSLTADHTGKNEGVDCSDEMSGCLTLVYSMAYLRDGVLTISVNSRTPITCDVEKLIEDLKAAWTRLGFTTTSTSFSKPYYVPVDDPHVIALQQLFHEITGLDNKPFVMSGGNYARVVPNAYSFGPGMPTEKKIRDFLPEGHGSFHSKDEAVVMEKLHECAKIYVMAVAMLDEMMD